MRTANPDLQAQRRAEIVKAAEQCFLKRGFHQTSMQNIAAASRLSMGLLYRYFANKEAIIAAVAQQDQDASLMAVAELPVEGDAVADWTTLLTDMAKVASSPNYAVLASEILAEANRSPKILQMLRDNDAELAAAIVQKLTEQQRVGAITPASDLDTTAWLLMALFDGLVMRMTMTDLKRVDRIETPFQMIISSVLGICRK
jgi:TetR/AcrR family transcriptional repressor of uid operon